MEQIKKACLGACYDPVDSVVIKKNELKRLYATIREYEELLEIYKKENQHYTKLLHNKLT